MPVCKNILFACILLTCFAGLNPKCLAQSIGKLETLTLNDGLSQGYVNCLLQDREGFIWMGTRNGLNRYDGRQFKIFTPNPFDTTSITADWVQSIHEYRDFLVLGFSRGGVNIFDKRTDRVYSLWSKNDREDLLRKASVNQSYCDRQGNLFLSIQLPGRHIRLLKINFPNGWPSHSGRSKIEVNFKILLSFKPEEQVNFAKASNGDKIWYAQDSCLKSMDMETGVVKAFDLPVALKGDRILNLNLASDETVWLATENHISRLKENQWAITNAAFPKRLFVEAASQGSVYAISGAQVYFFSVSDFQRDVLKLKDAGKVIALEKGVPLAVLQDKSGIIWIGVNGYGVAKYNPRLQRFKQYFPEESVSRPILVEASGNVSFVKQDGKVFSIAQQSLFDALPEALLKIDCIFRDRNGISWALSRSANEAVLLKFSPDEQWKAMTTFELGVNSILTFKPDKQGNIWMANSGRFFKYDPTRQKQTAFDYHTLVDRDQKVFDLVQTNNGDWWIATENGLVRAVEKTSGLDFQVLKMIPGNKNSLSRNDITSLLPDPGNPNILWIGTRGGGLNRLDRATMNITHLTTANGLPNDVIYGMLADDTGALWLSSNKGLIRYNPASGVIRNYTVADGLPTNEFNAWAYAKTPGGDLYFGCIEGLISFHPSRFIDNPVKPEVRITELKVNNQNITCGDGSGILTESIEFTRQITLPFSQNNISLELAALEYSIPSENRFRFYLQGAEPEWAHETSERTASYLNLQPGHYTFFAKACNSDGVWNETSISLQITIRPPWYRTTLAYVVYGLSLLAGIYGIFRFFLYRQQLNHKLVLEQKEAERLKELDDFKTKLYTNITHEFRTPLTVIQGMAEEVIHFDETKPFDGLKRAGRMIKRNGAGLLQLINQILDLAKVEANALKLQPVYADLVSYSKYLTGSYESLATTKGIRLHFHSDVEKAPLMLDKERMQTILSNLLSNALKFIPEKGIIDVQVHRSDNWETLLPPDHFLCLSPTGEEEGDWISITVKDNGSGISPSRLPYVFDRFYQASAIEEGRDADSRVVVGTGIGLALVKELVQLMGGALAVSSDAETGTAFVVVLPVVAPANNIQEAEQFFKDALAPEMLVTEIPAVSEAELMNNPTPGLPTILLIEDNADVMQYIIACVKDSYKVLIAQNGQQGIDKAFDVIPDLIVSDVMMPVKNGFEVLETLKNDERTNHIPIILLTALAAESDKLRALRMGVDDYLTKPFSPEELRARAANLVQNSRQRQAYKAKGIHIDFESTPSADQAWLEALEGLCLAAIEKRLDLSAGYLADQMALSERHLLRRLNVLTGLSTQQYIQEVKLQKARHQLEHKVYNTISEIAYASGFNTPNYFTKVFLQRFGKRPSEYLESLG